MALIEWTDDLSVRVEAIDAQHRQLVDLINELHEAMRIGQGKAALGKVLDDLVAYTKTHFAYEESLMALHEFADAADHAAEHHQLASQVVEMQRHYYDGTLVMTVEVMQFLKQWLAFHIQGTDKQYAAFFNEKGVV